MTHSTSSSFHTVPPVATDAPQAARNASGQATRGKGPAPDLAIAAQALRKVYKSQKGARAKEALKSIDLQIPKGSIFGLLGPNGAGKSTFINILAGLVLKTSGSVTVWGIDLDRDPRRARAAIGVVPQEIVMDVFFTPRETLEIQAGLYGVPKPERQTSRILDMIGLTDKQNAYVRSLSGGMKRRLLIGKAMVHNPPVLVLDEPTAGVDIELRRQLWDHVAELNRRGVTIVLTTHYLEEAQALCDTIAIINHGRVVASEPTQSLLHRIEEKTLLVQTDPPLTGGSGPALCLPHDVRRDGRLAIPYNPRLITMDELLAKIHGAGLTITDLSTEESDLEDIFMKLTYGADQG